MHTNINVCYLMHRHRHVDQKHSDAYFMQFGSSFTKFWFMSEFSKIYANLCLRRTFCQNFTLAINIYHVRPLKWYDPEHTNSSEFTYVKDLVKLLNLVIHITVE